MCSISGFFHPSSDYLNNEEFYQQILHRMMQSLHLRGQESSGCLLRRRSGRTQDSRDENIYLFR